MRSTFSFIFTVFFASAFGQQKILDTLNFESADYKFYFLDVRIDEEIDELEYPNEATKSLPPFQFEIDSTKSFLISDQRELTSLKLNWSTIQSETIWNCWYDYFVYIVQKNQVIHELAVNLECGYAVTDFGRFEFSGNPFEQLQNRIPIWVLATKHKSIEQGRKFTNSLSSSIFMKERKNWIDYDGYFSIDRDYTGKGSLNDFEELIYEHYPDKNYKLQISGAGPGSFTYNIYSDSAFYMNFKFEKNPDWKRLKPDWISVFSEDFQLLAELIN